MTMEYLFDSPIWKSGKEVLNSAEIAEVFRIQKSDLKTLIRFYGLPFHKKQGKRIFHRRDVIFWIDSMEKPDEE